jgi:hypothetical protein
VHKGRISAVKVMEFGRWCDIFALNIKAPTANKTDDEKGFIL